MALATVWVVPPERPPARFRRSTAQRCRGGARPRPDRRKKRRCRSHGARIYACRRSRGLGGREGRPYTLHMTAGRSAERPAAPLPGGIRPGHRGLTPAAPPCARLCNRVGSGIFQYPCPQAAIRAGRRNCGLGGREARPYTQYIPAGRSAGHPTARRHPPGKPGVHTPGSAMCSVVQQGGIRGHSITITAGCNPTPAYVPAVRAAARAAPTLCYNIKSKI